MKCHQHVAIGKLQAGIKERVEISMKNSSLFMMIKNIIILIQRNKYRNGNISSDIFSLNVYEDDGDDEKYEQEIGLTSMRCSSSTL
jgi:hypothetical protein